MEKPNWSPASAPSETFGVSCDSVVTPFPPPRTMCTAPAFSWPDTVASGSATAVSRMPSPLKSDWVPAVQTPAAAAGVPVAPSPSPSSAAARMPAPPRRHAFLACGTCLRPDAALRGASGQGCLDMGFLPVCSVCVWRRGRRTSGPDGRGCVAVSR